MQSELFMNQQKQLAKARFCIQNKERIRERKLWYEKYSGYLKRELQILGCFLAPHPGVFSVTLAYHKQTIEM